MKTVIEMAREAGFAEGIAEIVGLHGFERFAELVRADAIADEREKYKWDVHSCGPTCQRYACVAIREAVEAEREACAKVCEERLGPTATDFYGKTYAAAIRARSNT